MTAHLRLHVLPGDVLMRTPREGHHEEAGTMDGQVFDVLSVVLGFSL